MYKLTKERPSQSAIRQRDRFTAGTPVLHGVAIDGVTVGVSCCPDESNEDTFIAVAVFPNGDLICTGEVGTSHDAMGQVIERVLGEMAFSRSHPGQGLREFRYED